MQWDAHNYSQAFLSRINKYMENSGKEAFQNEIKGGESFCKNIVFPYATLLPLQIKPCQTDFWWYNYQQPGIKKIQTKKPKHLNNMTCMINLFQYFETVKSSYAK